MAAKIYLPENAYAVLSEDCKKIVGERSILLLDDENTHLAAGETLSSCLDKKSVKYNILKLSGDSSVAEILAEKIYDESIGRDLSRAA